MTELLWPNPQESWLYNMMWFFPLPVGFIFTAQVKEKHWPIFQSHLPCSSGSDYLEDVWLKIEAENWTISNYKTQFIMTGMNFCLNEPQAELSILLGEVMPTFLFCFVLKSSENFWTETNPIFFWKPLNRIKLELQNSFWNKLESNWYFIRSKSLVKIKCVVM